MEIEMKHQTGKAIATAETKLSKWLYEQLMKTGSLDYYRDIKRRNALTGYRALRLVGYLTGKGFMR